MLKNNNHKSRLLLILIVAVLFLVVVLATFFFLNSSNSPTITEDTEEIASEAVETMPEFDQQSSQGLEARVKEFNSIVNSGSFADAYKFIALDFRLDNSMTEIHDTIKNLSLLEDGIIVKDGESFVKHVRQICDNSDCSTKISAEGYKKWIYEFDDWYLTNEPVGCLRSEPYKNLPEFERALSFYKQRINSFLSAHDMDEFDFSYFDCIEIKYADLDEAEGYFVFDASGSSTDKLEVFVDNTYKEKDDLMTAFLLSHEIYHVISYVQMVNFGEKTDCVEEEVDAFMNQLFFTQTLKAQEKDIVNLRFSEGYYEITPPLRLMWDLWGFKKSADSLCGDDVECYESKVTSSIRNEILNSPYYQKQCEL